MYGGSGVAVAAPDEKLCPRTLVRAQLLSLVDITRRGCPASEGLRGELGNYHAHFVALIHNSLLFALLE